MMRKTALIALLLLVAASTLTIAQRPEARSEDPDVVLKTAMTRALVDGDLDAAIARYRDIATRYRTIAPPVAAKALVQIGASYEKLGRPESRTTYEQILRDFPNEHDAVALARVRIEAAADQADEPEIRRVWAGPITMMTGRPSLDGRYHTYLDETSHPGASNVAVRDLVTGESRPLTHATSGFAYTPVISADNTHVAYAWNDTQVRVMRFDGTGDRALTEFADGTPWGRLVWSPDGRQIATPVRRHGSFQLILISAADGSLTTLRSTGWRFPDVGGFSPDGRFLVYSLSNGESASDGGIFAIAVNGSGQTALAQGSSQDHSPVWTPDGRAVVFVSDRSGTPGLWLVRVDNGSPQDPPELLRKEVGEVNFGFTRDGTYFYGVRNVERDVYVAEIDPTTLEITAQPARLSDRFIGSNSGPTWSPDGRSVVFTRGNSTLAVRSVADGSERTLLASGQLREWFPDGRSLLVSNRDLSSNRLTFRRVELETGHETTVLETTYAGVYGPVRISPDGQSLYYSFKTPDGDLHLRRRDIATGGEAELYRLAGSSGLGFFGLSISRDGRQLAFTFNVPDSEVRSDEASRGLMTIASQGGTPRELHRGPYGCPMASSTEWTSDNRHVLVVCREAQGMRLLAFPAGGGEALKLNLVLDSISDVDVSPDGRRLAFTGMQRRPELWMIKNLLPSMRGSQ